jgi:hypothetical protein
MTSFAKQLNDPVLAKIGSILLKPGRNEIKTIKEPRPELFKRYSKYPGAFDRRLCNGCGLMGHYTKECPTFENFRK